MGNVKPIIFFDFDGVFVDSFDMVLDIARELNPSAEASHIRWVMEGNVFERLNELEHRGEFIIDKDFDKKYQARIAHHHLIPGMEDAVRDIAADHSLAIVSSSHSDPIRIFLETHGIGHHFPTVLGSDIHPKKTHKMRMHLDEHGSGGATKSLMVTDSLGDIEEARNLGIPSLAVSWGYHPEETIRKGNPGAIVREIAHLPRMIRELLAGS